MARLAADFRAFSVRGPAGRALKPERSFNPLSGKDKSSQFCIVTASGDVHAFLFENGVMTDLGTLPGRNDSNAFGINNRCQVVGESDPGTSPYLPHAFLFEHGVMTDLGTLPGDNFSEAVGITERGQVAGNSTSHAILWTREK